MQDMQEVTHDVHYESFRAKKLSQPNNELSTSPAVLVFPYPYSGSHWTKTWKSLARPHSLSLIAALIFSAGYYSAPTFLQFKEFELYWGAVFLQFKEIELYWGAVFFLRSVHTF